MKRAFLDTNILMDAVEFRKFGAEANAILDLCRAGEIEACAATMSFATLSYLLRHHPKEDIHEIFQDLSDAIEVVSVDTSQFIKAMLYGPVGDFEDLLQYQCAIAAGCEIIITNNIDDYQEFCQIPCLSARDFLFALKNSQIM